MRVFLSNPPWRHGDRVGVRAGSRWPHWHVLKSGRCLPDYLPFPFFLAYSAAVLEEAGVAVQLVDAIAEGLDEEAVLARITAAGPTLYVAETSTPSFANDVAHLERVRARTGGDAVIALAGPHVSALPREVLAACPAVDVLLLGEYEYTVLDLAHTLARTRDLSAVPGLVWRAPDGSIQRTPPRPLRADLDTIPWPARHLTPILNYNDAFCDLPTPNLQMWASRGCPFGCIFCLWPQVMYGGSRYRVRDPIKVVDEMAAVSVRYGMRSIYFDDDTFDIGKPRMLALASEIRRRGLTLPWGAMARADTLDREVLETLHAAGLYAIKYGVETSDLKLLEASGKRLDLRKLDQTVADTRALGIKMHLTFTFGLPGETWDTVRRTVDYALKLDPDSVQFSIVTPFPGTRHFKEAKRCGHLMTEDWSMFDGAGRAVIRTEQMSPEDLARALQYAYEIWESHEAFAGIIHNARGRRWHYLKHGVLDPRKAARFIRRHLRHMSRRALTRVLKMPTR